MQGCHEIRSPAAPCCSFLPHNAHCTHACLQAEADPAALETSKAYLAKLRGERRARLSLASSVAFASLSALGGASPPRFGPWHAATVSLSHPPCHPTPAHNRRLHPC